MTSSTATSARKSPSSREEVLLTTMLQTLRLSGHVSKPPPLSPSTRFCKFLHKQAEAAHRLFVAVPPAQSFMTDLRKFTREHAKMKCYGLGLGLDSFRMVALMENFRKLDAAVLLSAYQRRAPLCCARGWPKRCNHSFKRGNHSFIHSSCLYATLQPCRRSHASL